MTSDRDIKIDQGNYNEQVKGDYLETKVSANTLIQKAENVFIVEQEKSDTSDTQAPKSSSERD